MSEMVRAYTESLLKQILGTDELIRDPDGDYRVRYNSALYFVRIVDKRFDDPVVQVFAIGVDKVAASAELFEALNGINTELNYARTFWLRQQVLFESEVAGKALSLDAFSRACGSVASAADHFGRLLAQRFGGNTAFDDEKSVEYKPEPGYPGYL